MHVVDESSASRLLIEAAPLFAGEREVEGNLVLGVLEALGRGLYAEPPPWLWSVRDVSGLHGVALRTPPFPLTLSAMSQQACDAVAEAVAQRQRPCARAERMLRAGGAFLWDDGGAVCFASFGRRVGTGASIGSVYTPPALRGRGYASALVADLSQQLLDSGCRYTCLFTDLANPVSNSIYPKLGYRPVLDLRHVRVRAA